MQNLFQEMEDLLRKREEFFSQDGSLLRNLVIEKGLRLDPDLLKLLLSHNQIKQHFFTQVEQSLVFDKVKFLQFVSNKEFLPDSYTAFKNKIGLSDDGGETLLSQKREVALVWPYKDCVLKGGMTQEDQKRQEIFYNELLAPDEIDRLLDPKVFTNFKRIDKDGEEEFDGFKRDDKGRIKDNFIIKGNNLLVLTSLIDEFAGRIKLIYIDPPYNTGGSGDTFFYNNTFKHSTWYVFMKNRLEQARKLMTKDGFIAIAIDHYELFYLGVLADEIFGRENRIGIISVVHKPEGRNQEKFFATSNEFMLVYAKDITMANFNNVLLSDEKKAEYSLRDEKGAYKLMNYLRGGGGDPNLRINKPSFWYPIYVSEDLSKVSLEEFPGGIPVFPITKSGQERTWKTKPDTFQEALDNGYIVIQKDDDGEYQVLEKYYADEKGQLIKTHWTDKRYNAINQGTKVVEELLGSKEFSFPKSVYLVQDVVKIMADDDSIILDFFAGSGTTAHAVLDLNEEDGGTRNFILCEQLDYAENVTAKRVKKVIENNEHGDFIYMELAKWNEDWICKIQSAKSIEETTLIYKEIMESPFINYKVNMDELGRDQDEFESLSLEDQKKILFRLLDKNDLYVNYSEIEDETYSISEHEIVINKKFYRD